MQRVGYLALMLLVDETHETLMMVTNAMKTDLSTWHDPWIVINALTALANIASASMARDLAADVAALAEGSVLAERSITGALAGHVRKKALHAAARMVSRAPELAPQFQELPAAAISDGNHAVVLASAPCGCSVPVLSCAACVAGAHASNASSPARRGAQGVACAGARAAVEGGDGGGDLGRQLRDCARELAPADPLLCMFCVTCPLLLCTIALPLHCT